MPTVLIIDDNELNTRLAGTILSAAGYRVESTTRAEDTLTLMQAHRPDLVLMDIHMPGLDGVTALQLLRSDPRWRSTKVIALTATATLGNRNLLIGVGFDDYVSKPFTADELLERVGAALK